MSFTATCCLTRTSPTSGRTSRRCKEAVSLCRTRKFTSRQPRKGNRVHLNISPPELASTCFSKTKEPPDRLLSSRPSHKTGCWLNEDVDGKQKCLEKWIVYPLASRNTQGQKQTVKFDFLRKQKQRAKLQLFVTRVSHLTAITLLW
jgi:hypothetical protein